MYIAVVFVPLFNYFEGGRPAEAMKPTVMGETLHQRWPEQGRGGRVDGTGGNQNPEKFVGIALTGPRHA